MDEKIKGVFGRIYAVKTCTFFHTTSDSTQLCVGVTATQFYDITYSQPVTEKKGKCVSLQVEDLVAIVKSGTAVVVTFFPTPPTSLSAQFSSVYLFTFMTYLFP